MSAAYKVGDVAYGNFGAYGRIDVAQGTVSKVTPTGQVTVDFQRCSLRFKNDREIGGDLYHPATLINADDFARLKAKLRDMATVLLAQIEALPDAPA